MSGSAVIGTSPTPSGDGGTTAGDSPRRAFLSATITLTLALLGSSVLPLPFAFSRLGIVPGMAIMVAVALGNTLAGVLLLRAAGTLGRHTFEGLAEAVGGRPWRLATEVSLVVLLFGNLCGDLCLLADMGTIAAQELFPGGPPGWLVAGDGRAVLAVLAAGVVFPLSCMRHMRELERIATLGVLFVVVLAGVFIYYAVGEGMPAIASGELPLFRPAAAANIPESIGVLSFAFYLTPMLLPLLREMPAGGLGVELTCKAVEVVTVGVGCGVYAVVGIFAAARYGLRTEGDVLVNEWLPGRWDGVLSAVTTLYLSISMAPMVMALRFQLESLLIGEDAQPSRRQQIAITGGCVLGPLLVALPFPSQAEKMFAVTGATAVCAVCYVLPVLIHLKLYWRGSPGAAGKARREAHPGRHRRSFSFDSSLAATGRGGGSGIDARWLLGADFHAGSAALRGSGTAGAAPAALAQQQGWQQAGGDAQVQAATEAAMQQRWNGQAALEGNEEVEGGNGTASRLGGHRFTDLSLRRWLPGQSYDSLAGTHDSAPTTPMSPMSPDPHHRDMFGLCCDALLAASPGSFDQAHASLGSASGAEPVPALAGTGVLAAVPEAAAAVPAAPPMQPGLAGTTLPPAAAPSRELALVPAMQQAQGAALPAVSTGQRSDGAAAYPCLADAGSGLHVLRPLIWHVALPVTVMVLGVASSVSALWLAVAALRSMLIHA